MSEMNLTCRHNITAYPSRGAISAATCAAVILPGYPLATMYNLYTIPLPNNSREFTNHRPPPARRRPRRRAYSPEISIGKLKLRVTDHSMVSCESARQGQKPVGISSGNRAAIQRTVMMIREPVVRIQPGRKDSKLGERPLRAFLRITPLCTPPGAGPFLTSGQSGIWTVYTHNLRLEILDRIIVGAVNGKNRRKPGYVEHFSDWTLKRTEQNLAVRAIESLGRKEKHA